MSSILTANKNNVATVTHQLLARLKVKANKGTILATCRNHPNYTSLLAVSDCLTVLKVDHLAYLADKEIYSSGLALPFIAHFPGCAGRFVLIPLASGVNENHIHLKNICGSTRRNSFKNTLSARDLFLKPRAEAYSFFDKWLQQTEDLQVKLLFFIDNLEKNHQNQIAYHRMALGLKNKDLAAQALNYWYSLPNKNYEVWVKKAKISLPTIFVSGYKLPHPYKLEELKQLID